MERAPAHDVTALGASNASRKIKLKMPADQQIPYVKIWTKNEAATIIHPHGFSRESMSLSVKWKQNFLWIMGKLWVRMTVNLFCNRWSDQSTCLVWNKTRLVRNSPPRLGNGPAPCDQHHVGHLLRLLQLRPGGVGSNQRFVHRQNVICLVALVDYNLCSTPY